MRKILFIFILLLVFCFIACAKKQEPTNTPDPGNNDPVDPEPEPEPEPEETYYVIDFDAQNGRLIDNIKFKENEFPTLPTPEKANNIFKGWYEGETKVETITENKNYSLVAKWEKETFEIIFHIGDETETYILEFGKKIVAPSVEDYETEDYVYRFYGWDKDFSIATENLDIYAQFEETKLCKVNIYFGKTQIKSLKIEQYHSIGNLTLEDLDDGIYYRTLDSLYLNQELTSQFNLTSSVTTDMELYAKIRFKPFFTSTEGLTVSIMGDSISTFYSASSDVNSYYSGENQFYYPIYSAEVKKVELTWWYKAIAGLKCRLGINNSWSGSATYNNGSENNSSAMNMHRINTLDENGTPNIVITYLGTNDLGNGYSDINLKSGYRLMIKRIHEKYPSAYIFTINLGYTGYSGNGYSEEKRVLYNEMLASVSRDFNAFIIDWASSHTNDEMRSYLGDALHYNASGMEALSIVVMNRINEFFNDGIVL